MINLGELIELAMAAEEGNPIDWSNYEITREQAYQILASEVLERFQDAETNPDSATVLLATVVQLLVENMILNLKLMKNND